MKTKKCFAHQKVKTNHVYSLATYHARETIYSDIGKINYLEIQYLFKAICDSITNTYNTAN